MPTVHGTFLLTDCANPPAGGSVCFCDLPDCVDYCAEPIYEGDHAGMVALTITNATNEDCNDIFYGGYNFATSKFQVVIPDGCCIEYGCPLTGGSFEVTFDGVIEYDCSEEEYFVPWPSNLNTTFILPHIQSGSWHFFCVEQDGWHVCIDCKPVSPAIWGLHALYEGEREGWGLNAFCAFGFGLPIDIAVNGLVLSEHCCTDYYEDYIKYTGSTICEEWCYEELSPNAYQVGYGGDAGIEYSPA